MDKDSIAAEYALGGLSNNLFVSRYISYIPNKGQLIAQIEAVLNEWNKVEKGVVKMLDKVLRIEANTSSSLITYDLKSPKDLQNYRGMR